MIVRDQLWVRGVAECDFAINSPGPIGPLAYASVNAAGTVTSGTANISAIWNASSTRYDVTVADETINFATHSVTVTVVDLAEPRLATFNTLGGDVAVKIWDLNSGNVAVQDNFSIVIYDVNPVVLNRFSMPESVDEDKYVERAGESIIQTMPRYTPVEERVVVPVGGAALE